MKLEQLEQLAFPVLLNTKISQGRWHLRFPRKDDVGT